MDRRGRSAIGVLCRVVWRSTVGFHCQSIRFEGGGRKQLIGLKRTGKSCRLRWVNYLHPGLKRGKMTPQEELLVLQLHSKWGNRWSRIAQKLPGRTDNEIKNFWRTHMRKMAHQNKHHSPSSSSSSSSFSNSSSNNLAGEESFCNSGELSGEATGNFTEKKEEEEEKDHCRFYSMEDIWRDIEESVEKPGGSDEHGALSCPPMASPTWQMTEDGNFYVGF